MPRLKARIALTPYNQRLFSCKQIFLLLADIVPIGIVCTLNHYGSWYCPGMPYKQYCLALSWYFPQTSETRFSPCWFARPNRAVETVGGRCRVHLHLLEEHVVQSVAPVLPPCLMGSLNTRQKQHCGKLVPVAFRA